MTPHPRTLLAAAATAALSACAGLAPGPLAPAGEAVDAPARWFAPLPGTGAAASGPADSPPAASGVPALPTAPAALAGWWQRFDDPLLPALIDAAQAVSADLAGARSRIESARAARVAAGAALLPAVDASANASRGRSDLSFPAAISNASAGLQASWELDLFGADRAARAAAEARLVAARSDFEAARTALAAEVATSYTGLRACEAQLAQTRADAASRAETARLTALAARAGFQPPANAALARASAAQGNNLVTQQRASCELLVKSLVELTGSDEPALRERLALRAARLPEPAQIIPSAVPADALGQRPDLYSAGQAVVAASADVSEAEALRLPRIALSGSIGRGHLETSGVRVDGTVWSVGPVTVSLPVFDGGRLAANAEAARARADEAGLAYRARLRLAVREVEAALVTLQSTADRYADAETARQGFAESFNATETLYKGGLASLFELEDARRSAVQSEIALIDLRRERVNAWITLYRALGGGWMPPAADASPGGDLQARGEAAPLPGAP